MAGPNAAQAGFLCPSRPSGRLLPIPRRLGQPRSLRQFQHANSLLPFVAKTDYAANGGDLGWAGGGNAGEPNDWTGPGSVPSPTLTVQAIEGAIAALASNDRNNIWAPNLAWPMLKPSPAPAGVTSVVPSGNYTGAIWLRSETSLRMLSDGASKTYLIGEKYLDQFDYNLSESGSGDEENLYVGFDDDNIRLAANSGVFTASPQVYFPPMQDMAMWPTDVSITTRGKGRERSVFVQSFRFAHAGAFNMAFCDGSVHPITYEISNQVHCQLADRLDGASIESDFVSGRLNLDAPAEDWPRAAASRCQIVQRSLGASPHPAPCDHRPLMLAWLAVPHDHRLRGQRDRLPQRAGPTLAAVPA